MADRYVDCSRGDDTTGTGISKRPFKTISHALDVAMAGDIIRVQPGLYDEQNGESFPLAMKEGVHLQGLETPDDDMVMVHAPDGNFYQRPVIYGGAMIDIAGSDRFVTIMGADEALISIFVIFTVNSPETRANPAAQRDGVGIFCDSTSPTIRYNSFRGDGHAGISTEGPAQPHIEGNRFTRSVGRSIRAPIFSMTWGITAYGESEPRILLNHFACRNGIDNTAHSRAVVRANRIVCETAGIRIQDEASPTIFQNAIAGHEDQGIMINDAPTPLIHHNWIAENGSGDAWHGGVVIFFQSHVGMPHPDLGGGARGSNGGNIFKDNDPWDLQNWTPGEIYAMHNTWTHSLASDIDAMDIFDDDQSPTSGQVRF